MIHLVCLHIIFIYLTSASIQINAWVQQGYYYGHRCEVSFDITSDQLQSKIQIFNLITILNSYFLQTTPSYNNIFVNSIDNRQMKMAYTSNCPFSSYQAYQCIYINTIYNPASLIFQIPINQTFSSYIFRIQQVLCPSSVNDEMIMRFQMPIKSDYTNYYTPTYTTSGINFTKAQLTYAYDMNITINTSNLTYLEVTSVKFYIYNNFLIGCLFQYQITLTFTNMSYYHSWNQIQIKFSNPQILSKQNFCQTNLLLKNKCEVTTTGYKLLNLQKQNLLKSLYINEAQYFLYQPFVFSIFFNASFTQQGVQAIVVQILANQNILENSYNINFTGTSQYGYFTNFIYGLSQENYNTVIGSKMPTAQCIQSNQVTNSIVTINLIIFLFSVLLMVLFFVFRKKILLFEKFGYLLIILLSTILRLIYLSFNLNLQAHVISLYLYGQSAFQSPMLDFLIKSIFEAQILLSFLFSFVYLIFLVSSSEIVYKIKWMYGKKNECDISTLIFLFLFLVLILINYKFYSIMLFKLHLNTMYWKKFKKYRLKNQVIYIIHFIHLTFDFILQATIVISLSLMLDIKTANWISYFIIIVQSLQVYLLIIVIKCFYTMAKNSNLINNWQFYKLKKSLQNIQKRQKGIPGSEQVQETQQLKRLQEQMRNQMEWSENFNLSASKQGEQQKSLFQK